jgi:hypothetical protein
MLDLLLNLMLCYLATPSNIIRKVKHYKETIIAIISLLTCVNHHLRLIVVWMFLSRTRPAVSSIEPHWLIGSKPVEKQLQQYYISLSPASVVERLAEPESVAVSTPLPIIFTEQSAVHFPLIVNVFEGIRWLAGVGKRCRVLGRWWQLRRRELKIAVSTSEHQHKMMLTIIISPSFLVCHWPSKYTRGSGD